MPPRFAAPGQLRSRSASSVVVSGPREGTFRHLVHVSRNSEGKLEVSNVGADGDTGLTTDFLKAFSSFPHLSALKLDGPGAKKNPATRSQSTSGMTSVSSNSQAPQRRHTNADLKKLKKGIRDRSITIGAPTEFRHVAHLGSDNKANSEITAVMGSK